MKSEKLLENIDAMEKILSEMKKEYKKESEQEYRASPHKSFKVGDWVQRNKEFGKVRWIKNEGLNLKEEDGYVGIELYSGTRGFSVGRRDDWDIMSDKDVEYLTNVHEVKLTGEEICELHYLLRCCNWSKVKEEVRKKIELVGDFSLFKKDV